MKTRTVLRNIVGLAIILAVAAALMPAQEQQQPAPSPPPAPSPSPSPGPDPGMPGGRTPSIPTPSPVPSPRDQQPRQPDFGREQQQQQFPDMQRPIFLSGKVVLDDGTAPPEPVVVERVCNGQPRPEGYTDSKGRFSFQLGQNMGMIPDASVGSAADSMGGFGSTSGSFGRSRTGVTERDLMGCELRATLPGFRSDVVNLAGRRLMDNPDVGTIVLRRLGNVEGTTISATTLQAPKDARKAFEKATEALRKKKTDEAQKNLEKAVQLYPQYATAWYELGALYQQQNNAAQAREAYGKSLAADAKFMKPYLQLALLAAQEQKWQEVADTTDRLLALDAYDYPRAWFFNAVANFNLRKIDAAEKSIRQGLKLDTQHSIPKLNHLLGIILFNKQDFTGASEHLRSYLQHAPNAQDADTVRKQLAELDKVTGQAAAAQPQAPQPQP